MALAVRTALAAVAIGAAAIVAAAPPAAHADDEYGFVSYLEDDGIHYQSLGDALSLGNLACRELRAGVDVTQVSRNVKSAIEQLPPPASKDSTPVPTPGSILAGVVAGASSVLCPDQRQRVNEWAGIR